MMQVETAGTPLSNAEVEQGNVRDYPQGLYPWYVVSVLLVLWTLSNIDRFSINIIILPIQKDLSLSETQMGLLLGPAFTIFYVAASLPMGKLADQLNRRNLLMAGLAVWSVGTFAGGFARSFEGLFLARAIVGFGEACLVPAAFSLIADYFSPSHRGKAIAIVSVGLAAGSGLALIGGGAVLELMQGVEKRSLPIVGVKTAWELVFICFGVAGIAMGLLLLTIREPARREAPKHLGSRSSFIAFLRTRPLSMFLIITPYVLVSYILLTFAAWAPTLLVRHVGMALGDAAQMKGLITLVIASVATIVGGIAGDQLTRRHGSGRFLLVTIPAPLVLPGLILACLGTEIWIAALGMALMMTAGSLISPTVYAALQDVVPANVRGRVLALYSLLQHLIGLGVGPAAVALITEHMLGDPSRLHISILLATIPAWIGLFLCGILGRAHFRAMRVTSAIDA